MGVEREDVTARDGVSRHGVGYRFRIVGHVGLRPAPADHLLGREAPVVVDEMRAVVLQGPNRRRLRRVAAHPRHHHRPAATKGRLIPGEVDQLVGHREGEGLADPTHGPGDRPRPVHPVRALLAAEDLEVPGRDPAGSQGAHRLGCASRVVDDRQQSIDGIPDRTAGGGRTHGAMLARDAQ